MAYTLYLTADEKKKFEKLSDGLREGWKVQNEKLTTDDSLEDLRLRATFLQIRTPALKEFQQRCAEADSEQAFEKLVDKLDLSSVSNDEIFELLFVVGPVGMTAMVDDLLDKVASDADIQTLAAFTMQRHVLIKSHSPQYV